VAFALFVVRMAWVGLGPNPACTRDSATHGRLRLPSRLRLRFSVSRSLSGPGSRL
jgi:hypothetical protein